MKVTYIGQHDEVEVPTLDWAVVKRGQTIDVSDALGKNLCQQTDNWTAAKPEKPKE